VPKNYPSSVSNISLIGVAGVEAGLMTEGAIDAIAFDVYCQEIMPEISKDPYFNNGYHLR
jgi:hypothetical protein